MTVFLVIEKKILVCFGAVRVASSIEGPMLSLLSHYSFFLISKKTQNIKEFLPDTKEPFCVKIERKYIYIFSENFLTIRFIYLNHKTHTHTQEIWLILPVEYACFKD